MSTDLSLLDIHIRTILQPGDLSHVVYRHSKIYHEECNYGIAFESYVCAGIHEFYQNYDLDKDRVWICEHQKEIIGFLSLMHRPNNTAQLRFFYLERAYRGIGLGKKLMRLFMEAVDEIGYNTVYLWTTVEQHTASALYTRLGFRLTEEKEASIFGKPLIEQKYSWVKLSGQ